MSDLETSIVIDLAGNLQQQASRYGQSLQQFSRRGSRSMSTLTRSIKTVNRGLDRMGNRYSALLTGAAGAGSARMLISLEERFTRLGIQANKSADDMDRLKTAIYDTSQQANVRIDPSQLTSAVEDIVEKTGDLDFATANLESFALAISATGAEGKAIGGIAAEFQKMGIIDPKQVREALDILTVQGKEGAFTLENLAALGPRVVTAYTSMGRGGVQGIREMGAALQVIRQGTGSSEQAATAFEAVLRTLSDPKKLAILKSGGLKIFADDQEKVIRPINELMVDIIKKTNGKKSVLGQVFDAEAVRAFNAAVSEYNRTGGVESMEKFMNLQADGSHILADSSRAATTAAASLRNLYSVGEQFADQNLSGPIQELADQFNSLNPDEIERYFEVAKRGVLLLGGAIVASKMGSGLYKLNKMRGGKTAGGLASAAAGPMPVYVVNMGPGMGNGVMPAEANDDEGKKGKKRRSKKFRVARGAGLGAMAIGSAYSVYDIATSNDSTLDKVDAGLEVAGGMAGGLAGAKVGALIGTAIFPGIGTVIGTALGGLGGYLAGEFAGDKFGDWATAAPSADEIGEAVAKAMQEKEGKGGVEVLGGGAVTSVTANGINLEAAGPTMMLD